MLATTLWHFTGRQCYSFNALLTLAPRVKIEKKAKTKAGQKDDSKNLATAMWARALMTESCSTDACLRMPHSLLQFCVLRKKTFLQGSQARQSNERLCTVTRFETEANAIGREASQSVRTQCWSVDFLLSLRLLRHNTRNHGKFNGVSSVPSELRTQKQSKKPFHMLLWISRTVTVVVKFEVA